jgi:hypothetical protein
MDSVLEPAAIGLSRSMLGASEHAEMIDPSASESVHQGDPLYSPGPTNSAVQEPVF